MMTSQEAETALQFVNLYFYPAAKTGLLAHELAGISLILAQALALAQRLILVDRARAMICTCPQRYKGPPINCTLHRWGNCRWAGPALERVDSSSNGTYSISTYVATTGCLQCWRWDGMGWDGSIEWTSGCSNLVFRASGM